MKRNIVQVYLQDDKVYVSCNHGQVEVSPKTDSWLWLLNAVAFPEDCTLEIMDERKHRQEHQKDVSCVLNEI